MLYDNPMVVTSILHLSDVHIRAGDAERSREEEYRAVFERLFALLRRFPAVAAGEAIIVVTGDLFHNKHKLDPHGVRLGVQLLRGLAEIAPTFVIRGNHDYRQDQPDELDLISAITSYEIPNLTYLDETGTYEIENVGIGLVAIQDTLLYGATSGIVEELPPFPSVSDFSSDVTHRVALFHGSVVHAKLQNGMACETGHGYPLEWFKGYDLVLLGDIHLQQVHRATAVEGTERVEESASLLRTHTVGTSSAGGTWAYPGSLLQQDFGEPLLGHGILHWDLRGGTVEEFHVWNPYGYVTLHVKEGEVRCFHRAQGALRGAWVPLQEMLVLPWFPQKLSVRVMTDRVSDLLACRRALEEAGRELTLFVQIRSGGGTGAGAGAGAGASVHEKGDSGTEEENAGEGGEGAEDKGLPDINSPALWSQFVKENAAGRLEEGSWERWLASPETMLVPTEGLEEGLVGVIRDKNDKVFRSVEALRSELEAAGRGGGEMPSVRLLRVEWSWLFNFGAGNTFDFEKHEGKICVLNAKNGCGKSNFFEVLCVALFGTGFPSRHNKAYSGAIINRRLPTGEGGVGAGAGAGAGTGKGKRKGSGGEEARSEIVFAYAGRTYRLLRTMAPRKDNRNLFDFGKIILSVLEEGGGGAGGAAGGEVWTVVHQKKLAVDTWLEEHLGTAETFLSSAMLTQDGDYNFFELDKPSQKRVLDNVFSLGPVQALSGVFAEAIKAHKTSASHGRTYLMGQARKGKKAGGSGGGEETDVDALRLRQAALEAEVETLRGKIDAANSIWSSHPLRVFREKSLEAYAAELAALEAELTGMEEGGGEESLEALRERKMRFGLERERLAKKLQGKKRPVGVDGEGMERPDVEDVVELERRYKRLQALVGVFGQGDDERGDEEGEEEQEEDLDAWEAFVHEKRAWVAQWKRKGVDVERLGGSGGGGGDVAELRSQLEEHERVRPPMVEASRAERVRWPEEELVRREKRLVEWKRGCETYAALSKEFDGIGKEMASLRSQKREYGKLPFNPDCGACKAQPWRSVLEGVESRLPLLQKRCDEVCEEMETVLEQFAELDGGEGEDEEGGEDTLVTLQKGCRTEETRLVAWRQSVEASRWSNWKLRLELLRKALAEAEVAAAVWDEKGVWERRQAEVARGVRLGWSRVAEMWEAWRVWQDTELWRLADEADRNFNAADSALAGRIAREKTVGKIEVLREIVRVFPAWAEEEALRRRVGEVEKELSVVVETLEAYESAAWRESMERWIDGVESRQKALEVLADVFKGYRAWVYKELLGPRIGSAVNGLLIDVCDDRPLVLDAEWNDDLDTYTWFLVDGAVRNILEKASGFQRFIVGLAMRVAMSRLGICKVVYEQLFIDEGFTACDSDNLEKAPAFLRALLGAYRCIVLATHLEDLKACGDVQIGIGIGEGGGALCA